MQGVFYNLQTNSTYLRGCLRKGLVDHLLQYTTQIRIVLF
jgi:hypothetical protein